MAPTGRPPKPIEMKRRLGNPGKRKLPAKATTTAIAPSAAMPPVPISLGQPGVALWKELLEQAPWLARVDHMKIEELCHLKDEVEEMRRRIAEEGLTQVEPIVTPAGMVVGERMVPHPLLKELRSAQKLLEGIGSQLGLDPTSRSRLGLAEVKKRSILDELYANQQASAGRQGSGRRRIKADVVEAEVIDIAPDA